MSWSLRTGGDKGQGWIEGGTRVLDRLAPCQMRVCELRRAFFVSCFKIRFHNDWNPDSRS